MNKIIKRVSATIIYDNAFPYRIKIGNVTRIARSPKDAVIIALSVGRLIPPEIRYNEDKIMNFLERNYDDTPNRNILINTIRRNRII